jgi:hypothetical protein
MTPKSRPKSRRKVGPGTFVAAGFVAVAWAMITVLAIARARVVGRPGLLRDEGVIAMSGLSATIAILASTGLRRLLRRPWDGES